MLIRLTTLITLALMWLGLMGMPKEKVKIIFLIIIPLIIWLFSIKIGVIEKGKTNSMKLFALNGFNRVIYFLWLIKEILISAFSVIKIIWGKDVNIEGIFEWIEAEKLGEVSLVTYGNSITLTPGTVTLDIKDNMLLVHALTKSSIDDLKQEIMLNKIKKIKLI